MKAAKSHLTGMSADRDERPGNSLKPTRSGAAQKAWPWLRPGVPTAWCC